MVFFSASILVVIVWLRGVVDLVVTLTCGRFGELVFVMMGVLDVGDLVVFVKFRFGGCFVGWPVVCGLLL